MPDENKLANIEPETREETFLQDIADGTQTLTPAVRKEEFLRRIAAKPGVPSITESDEGKVLTVESGEAVWGESSSLPEITAQDEGKVLTVESGEAAWGEASSLPEITAQDEGKVLTVESGEAVWGGCDCLPDYSTKESGMVLMLEDAYFPVESFIPEQTGTIEDANLFPTNVSLDPSSVSDGDLALFTISGNSYLLTAEVGEYVLFTNGDPQYDPQISIVFYNDAWIVDTGDITGTVTYKADIVTEGLRPVWKFASQ